MEEYAASTGKTYSATMVVRDNGFAYLLEDEDGVVSSQVIPWLKQDYKVSGDEDNLKQTPTGPLYSAGYLELDNGQLLKPFSDGQKLVFSKESDSMEPLLRCIQLPGCTVDTPIELLDGYDESRAVDTDIYSMYEGTSVGIRNKRFEGRSYSSAYLGVHHSIKGRDERVEGEELAIGENTVYFSNETKSGEDAVATVRFLLERPSRSGSSYNSVFLYEVSFHYKVREAPYYESYANSLPERVHIGNDSIPDVVAIADSSSDTTYDIGYEDGPISWQDAPQHIGEYVEVFGTVAATNYSPESDGQPTFIDIGEAYPSPNRVTAVIWGEDRGNFPYAPEEMYEGRYVKVEGELYQHDGVCNIRVSWPDQIVMN